MSVLRCDNCGNLIDTDFDVEAWIEEIDQHFCPPCRADWPIPKGLRKPAEETE